MNANGSSDTSARATTRTMGRDSRSSGLTPAAKITGALPLPEHAGEDVGKGGRGRGGYGRKGARRHFAELDEAAFAAAEHVDRVDHFDEIDGPPRFELEVPAELHGPATSAETRALGPPQHQDRERADHRQGH